MSNVIFAAFAALFWLACPAMPLRTNSKAPLLPRWQELCFRMPTPVKQTDWLTNYPDNNIGLPLGTQWRPRMIDIDADDEQAVLGNVALGQALSGIS